MRSSGLDESRVETVWQLLWLDEINKYLEIELNDTDGIWNNSVWYDFDFYINSLSLQWSYYSLFLFLLNIFIEFFDEYIKTRKSKILIPFYVQPRKV